MSQYLNCKVTNTEMTQKELSHMLVRCSGLDLQSENEKEFEPTDSGASLPPPKPYFERLSRPNEPSTLFTTLSRARSSSPSRQGKDFLKSRNMTHSLPNLLSSRATHNRSVGQHLSADSVECASARVTPKRHSRVEEFDALLEDL